MVKKAILPIAGLGTRFLPLSKTLPKEMWPLIDKPVFQYVLEEAISSQIKEIVFVSAPEKRIIWNYCTDSPRILEKILKERKKKEMLQELKAVDKILKKVSLSLVYQKERLGDGHAILQAKRKIKKEPVAVLFADDVIEAKEPALSQMIKIYKKYQKPIVGVFQIEKKRISSYGVVEIEKLKGEKRVFKVKRVVEKPKPQEAPSNFAIVGRYILTPEVFEFLKKAKKGKTGEIHLSEVFQEMINQNKEILAYWIRGRWLECGNKENYLKSLIYLCLKHPFFGKKIKPWLSSLLQK